MDLNYLYRRHGISLYLAKNAACDCSHLAHEAFARAYAADPNAPTAQRLN